MSEPTDNWAKELIQHLFGALTTALGRLQIQPFIFVIAVGLLLIIVLVISVVGVQESDSPGSQMVGIVVAVLAGLALVALVGYYFLELRPRSQEDASKPPAEVQAEPSDGPSPPSPVPPHIPFKNREDEIVTILSSYAPPYYLLDAPAGYGKTRLLGELENRFREQGWLCAYVSTRENRTLPEITYSLAQRLRVELPSTLDMSQLGPGLAAALQEQKRSDLTRRGLVLLVDLDKEPSLPILDSLLQDFVPRMQSSLLNLEFFANGHNRFRVVLAGRCLARSEEVKHSGIRLTIYQLTPFEYSVVRDAAREYLVGYDDDRVAEIAAYVVVLTGGHPGCMAQVLELARTRGASARQLMEDYHDEIWREIVRPVVGDVREGIPSPKRGFLDRLSIYRRLDYATLRHLISGSDPEIPGYDSEMDLAFELTATYLLTKQGRFLQDDITRRLLAIRLRRELGDVEFLNRSMKVQAICAERICERATSQQELWVIEYLFQFLQAHARHSLDAKARLALRQQFFDHELPAGLNMFVGHGRNLYEDKQVLVQSLERDWEFCLLLNFALSPEGYNEEPFEHLLQRVEEFFGAMLHGEVEND